MVPTGLRSFLLALSLVLAACSTTQEFRELPDDYVPPPDTTIQARIAAYEAAPPEKRSTSIARVLYNGRPAYLVASPCCDRFNYLYDAKGQRLCAPSGGIAGRGDGKCTGTIKHEGTATELPPPAAERP